MNIPGFWPCPTCGVRTRHAAISKSDEGVLVRCITCGHERTVEIAVVPEDLNAEEALRILPNRNGKE